MKNIETLLNEFSQRAIDYNKYGLDGDYKRNNAEVKKINKIFQEIKRQQQMNKLLELIYSDVPEISSLAATFCMRYNPDKCISVLKTLANKNIPQISFGAKYAILNWENGEWYID